MTDPDATERIEPRYPPPGAIRHHTTGNGRPNMEYRRDRPGRSDRPQATPRPPRAARRGTRESSPQETSEHLEAIVARAARRRVALGMLVIMPLCMVAGWLGGWAGATVALRYVLGG